MARETSYSAARARLASLCDEVAEGRWDGQFVVDLMEGSGGTSAAQEARRD